MPYSKQTWSDNNPTYPLSAARMGVIEQGIFDAAAVADQGHRILSTSAKNALTGVATGTHVYDSTLGELQVYNGSTWVPAGYAGAWTSWTPAAFTQSGALTVSQYVARYKTMGKVAFVQFYANVTGGGTATNNILLTLPTALTIVSQNPAYYPVGFGDLYNGNRFPFFVMTNSSATVLRFKPTNTIADDILGTSQFTGALGSAQIQFTGMWELANA